MSRLFVCQSSAFIPVTKTIFLLCVALACSCLFFLFLKTYVARARDHLLSAREDILSSSVGSDTEKSWNEPERIWTDADEDLNNIRGVWVISDDPEVFKQVRRLAPLYFPGVKSGRGVVNGWASKWKDSKDRKQVSFRTLLNQF